MYCCWCRCLLQNVWKINNRFLRTQHINSHKVMLHSHPRIIDPIENVPKESETSMKILIFPKWFIAIQKIKSMNFTVKTLYPNRRLKHWIMNKSKRESWMWKKKGKKNFDVCRSIRSKSCSTRKCDLWSCCSSLRILIFRQTSFNVIDCCRHCSITTVYSINWPNVL